jgi:hypothetical protein
MTEKELASRQKQESKRKLVKIKQTSGCVDCGENNHIVLDFDHIKDKKYNMVNWASTIIGIILGFSAVLGLIKESGKNAAIEENIAAQTQKQWELRQIDSKTINDLKVKLSAMESDIEWLKRGHKTVDSQ